MPNPNTWAAVANMLYIDSPVGTGLSYSASSAADGSTTELDVAKTLTAFFQAFYRGERCRAVLSGACRAGPPTCCSNGPLNLAAACQLPRCLVHRQVPCRPHAPLCLHLGAPVLLHSSALLSNTSHRPAFPGAAPQYAALAKSRLILAGESFAGHYIPAAAAYMRAYAPSLPLYGVAMGNPWTNSPSQ